MAARDRARGLMRRRVIAPVVVLALVAGVAGWDRWIRGPGVPPTPPRVLVATSARAWLAAWERGDIARLERLTTQPAPSLRQTVLAFADGLGTSSLTATPRRPRIIDDDRATVPFDVSIDLAGLGTWRYEGSLPLAKVERRGDDGKRWRVAWSPSVLHPALTASTQVSRVLTWPDRAPILDGDGTQLAESRFRSLAGRLGAASPATATSLGRWYRVGDVVGVSGLQARLERRLAGTPATEVRLVQGRRTVALLAHFIGVTPRPLRLTLDPDAQAAAEAAVDAGLAARRLADDPPLPPKQAAMVVIQPSTGSVLASVSRPSGGFDRALMGRYPPGSTFKVVTTLGLLEKGVSPSTIVSCPKSVKVGGREFNNAEGHALGDTTFRTAFAQSCNTAFVQLAGKLTPAEFKAVADSLGFNRVPPFPLPVSMSSVPLPQGAVDEAASAIGQARVSVTPFQMASVAAAVAAGGVRDPRLVDDGPPVALRPFPPGVQATMAGLMRLVVTDGTGKKARLAGTPVAGKTGTAEFGTDDPPRVHAWFIAFRGDLAVAVIMEDAGFGGDWAAPVAADFFRRMS
ncbi:MAG: hypothetical protein JF603_12100 [Acidobacteria bacterium]|nr:hypothetical protein [Acidobacteriota bacterium]